MASHRCRCEGEQHPTFGACMRAKGVRVGYCRSAAGGLDYTREKAAERELEAYRRARKQGIQPDSTRTAAIRAALDISDRTGRAYGYGTSG